MKRRNGKYLYPLIWWTSILLVLAVAFFAVFIKVKPLVFTYAKSTAEVTMLNAANKAVLNVLSKYGISYDTISHISRDKDGVIQGVEIDTKEINILKSAISNEIDCIMDDSKIYDISIPCGTLLGNEYTTGMGPKFNFKMQFTHTALVDFESKFETAGINQTLHKIVIKINLCGNILMIGCTEGFSVSTGVIAAQTVIVGTVPDSFTSVEELPYSDTADDIFNFSE